MAKIVFIFVLLLIVFQILLLAQKTSSVESPPTLVHYVGFGCSSISNDTTPSLDKRRKFLGDVLLNISSKFSTPVKFFKDTVGDVPNKIYILFQCRNDLSLDYCWDCYKDVRKKIVNACTLYDEAVVWDEECMLRYAYYRNIFSLNETKPSADPKPDEESAVVTDYPQFAAVRVKLMNDVIKKAATKGNNNGSGYFATMEANLTSSDKLYGLAQCTPDIDGSECQSCLKIAWTSMLDCCNRNISVMEFFPSCQLRYDNQPILLQVQPEPVTPGNNPERPPTKAGVIAAIAAAASVGFVLLVGCVWLCRRKKTSPEQLSEHMVSLEAKHRFQHGIEGDMDDITSLESIQFNYNEVKAATSNFSEKNKLGQGGFGEVYKGKLSNGEIIAVKRLSKYSQQGTIEFKNEVLLVAKLQHRNLVKLLGFSISGAEKILIYEYLSNSSLDRFLYDEVKRASLGWKQRFRIITGIARGLLYLHEDSRLKIIHRDLKSSNILLDEGMNAKIADFGLAKLFDLDQTQGDTMRIVGTFGYMAPEYAMAGQFSVKSDIYSFGVIVLEIVSGQRNTFYHRQQAEEVLLYRAWRLWNEGAILDLVDSELGHMFSEQEVKLCILIGLLCIQEDAAHRPRMASVVTALNGQSITLPSPNAPHFFTLSSSNEATSSSYTIPRSDEHQYRESDNSIEMSSTDLYPR